MSQTYYDLTDSDFDQRGHPTMNTPYLLVFYKLEGCGHCEHFFPTWVQLTRSKKRIGNDRMVYGIVERNENPRLFGRMRSFPYQIQGFPTVILFDNRNNQWIEYEGPRTVEGISYFLENAVQRA